MSSREFPVRPNKTLFQPQRDLSLPDMVPSQPDMPLRRPERLSLGLAKSFVGLTGLSAGPEQNLNYLRGPSVSTIRYYSVSLRASLLERKGPEKRGLR